MPRGVGEQIAEEMLREALCDLCRGGSWRGVARGLAWRVVVDGTGDRRSIEMLTETAEEIFGSMIDDALWHVEQTALRTWDEFLELRPGDQEGALVAARLDASEESVRLLEVTCERVAKALRGGRRAA